MTLDIVFGIGCPVACKYCPQEVITRRHKMHPLSFEDFKRFLSTIPKDELLIFAGISEPFVFPDAVKIIRYAHDQGYKMNLFTTLVGLSFEDATKLVNIPFNKVMLHLPDSYGNAKIPYTEDYGRVLHLFLSKVENIQCMHMGKNFTSDHNEDVLRGNVRERKNYRVMCPNLGERAYMLFPDGMVTLCCMLRGMEGKIGNLNVDTYPELMARYDKIAEQYQKNQNNMCHLCSVAENYHWYHLKKPISALIRNQKVLQVRNRLKVFPVAVNQLNSDEGLQ